LYTFTYNLKKVLKAGVEVDKDDAFTFEDQNGKTWEIIKKEDTAVHKIEAERSPEKVEIQSPAVVNAESIYL